MKTFLIIAASIVLVLVVVFLLFKSLLKKIDFDPDEEFLGN